MCNGNKTKGLVAEAVVSASRGHKVIAQDVIAQSVVRS